MEEEQTPDFELISMNRSRLLATLLLLYGWRWLLVLTLAVLVTMFIGILVDVRWAIISLMLIFIATPLLMAYLFFYHGLKPITAINVVPHELAIEEKGVTVIIPEQIFTEQKGRDKSEYQKRDDRETEQKCKIDSKGVSGIHNNEISVKREKRIIFYLYSDFRSHYTGNTGFLLMARDITKGFLWLPYSSFQDSQQREMFLSEFHKSQPKI